MAAKQGQPPVCTITAGNSTVRSLVINGFGSSGILLPVAGGNVIQGNYIGTDPIGRVDLGNGQAGVWITPGSSDNLIGTDGNGLGDTAERNLISANTWSGVAIQGLNTERNIVAGNYIGTDVDG